MTAFDPESITAEFQVAGTWYDEYAGVNLASRIRGGDSIRITRAYVDQQSSYTPSNVACTLNNRDGLFSPENALSPLYGKIGQNLPIRLGVQDDAGTWDEYLRMPDFDVISPAQKMSTADKASLDITGDIDIRIEFTATYLRNRRQNLAAKYLVSGNNRSWHLELRSDGQFAFLTSPDGTLTNALTNTSGVVIGESAGRIAIRVTLDVNNGAGGRVYTWYASDSIDGTWTQFATATVAGTTSIFSGTSAVEVGSANSASGPFGPDDSRQFAGRIHAFQVYNGIGGTLVADFRPQGRGVGQVSWADTCASPNTWEITGDNIRLASDRIRLAGEISELPEEWDLTGADRYVRISAATIGKRYLSNKSPLGSAIYRLYRNRLDMMAYFTMEDQAGATQAANVIESFRPGALTQCTFGSTTGLDGSAGALTLTSAPNVSKAILNSKLPLTPTGTTTIVFYFNLATLPAADATLAVLWMAPGTVSKWDFRISSTTFRFVAYDNTVTEIYNTGPVLFGSGASPLDQWIGMQILLTQSGGNIQLDTVWHAVGTEIFYTHQLGGTTFAGTLGRGISRAQFQTPDVAYAGAQIAHVIISAENNLNFASYAFAQASKGYSGETAGRRMVRLADEEGEFFEWVGDIDDTAPVGPQTPDRLVNLFTSAAAVDGGLFGDIRDTKGWRYVTRAALGNRHGLELSYAMSHLDATPKPTTGDRYTVNDFTASRPAGSSARYVADDGRPKNINDPDHPTTPGVGRYELTGAFNAATDDQLYGLSSAQVAIGTWPESRIPNLSVALHRDEVSEDAGTVYDVIAADFGDPVGLVGLDDAPMAGGDRRMVVFGYTETIGQGGTWGWVSNTVPAGPYQVPILGTTDVNGEPRMDADFENHVQIHGAYSTSATSIILRTDQDFAAKQVIDSTSYSAEFPCDLNLAGEQVTMTACTAPSSSAAIVAGTFEAGVGGSSGWNASGGSIADSAVFAHGGTQSALLTVSGSPTSANIRPMAANAAPVTEGKSYTFTVWVRSVALLSSVSAFINWIDASGATLSTSSGSASSLSSGAWASRTVTATAPAGAVAARYGPSVGGSPANGTLLYVDDATFTSTGYVYQTATVTRDVNNINKAQVDGTEVHLWETFNLGMG